MRKIYVVADYVAGVAVLCPWSGKNKRERREMDEGSKIVDGER